MTDSSQTRIAYVKETTYGVTPATPAFQKFRTTSVPSLSPENQFLMSDEIRDDRNMPAATYSGQTAAFELPIEFSYESFDDMIAAFMASNWSSDVIKNGVTPQSFTFENLFAMPSGNKYQRVVGAMVNTFALSVSANEKVTGSFGLMGKRGTSAPTAITGATYVDPNNNDFFRATDDFAIVLGGGVGGVAVRSLTMSGTNNNRMRPVIGSDTTDGIGLGRFEVGGTIEAYFNSSALYDKFLADEYLPLQLNFSDSLSGSYEFLFPRIKFTGGRVNGGGNNEDVMVSMTWQATFDETEACALKITRDPV